MLLLREVEQVLSQGLNISPGRKIVETIKPGLLISRELDARLGASLEVNVESVEKVNALRRQVFLGSTEEVLRPKGPIAMHKRTTKPRKLGLNQALNTNIFNDVEAGVSETLQRLVATRDLLDTLFPLVEFSIKSMRHLVADEQVVNLRGHISQDGHRKCPIHKIERCRLGFTVMHDRQILTRKQAGEHIFRMSLSISHASIIPLKSTLASAECEKSTFSPDFLDTLTDP